MPAQIVWHSLQLLPLAIALAFALVVAVLWLYASQLARMKSPWKWVLPGLRVAGLLVLVTALLQPAVQRLRRADERSAVLVLVDQSKSMSVTDSARTSAQLVALADALGQLPPGARDRAISQITGALERLREQLAEVNSATHDAETAEAFGRGVESARARLNSARTAFAESAAAVGVDAPPLTVAPELRVHLDAVEEIPDPTNDDAWATDARGRIDAALAAGVTAQGQADQKLYETRPDVKAVCDALGRLSRWSLVEQSLMRPEIGIISQVGRDLPIAGYLVSDRIQPVPLEAATAQLPGSPVGQASNLAGAVPAALASASGRPVRAAVLFSDGHQVGANAAIVSSMTPAGVPVFCVGVAPEERAKDIAFQPDLVVEGSAFVGETVRIRAMVTAVGLPTPDTEIQLRAGDTLLSQRIEPRADGAPTPVQFSLPLTTGGPQKIVLSMPPAAGEITAENNVIERWIKVLPQRMKVAAYAGTPGWDFQLLRRALAQSVGMELEFGILDPQEPRLPLTPEQILQQDVIILSDVSAGALDDVQWDAVNQFVRDRGGSLFLIAGPDHLPSSYTPATIVASSLLPYDVRSFSPIWRTWPGEQPAFRFISAPQIRFDQLEALRLGSPSEESLNWQSPGSTFRFMPIVELNTRFETKPLLIEADSRLPVVTESFPGNGRVLFFGTNETWRWRAVVSDGGFDRFWLQLIHYAAGEPYAVQRDLVALDIDEVAPAPQQPVAVRARILTGEGEGYRIDVLREGTILHSVGLTRDPSMQGGHFTATIPGLDAGDYVIRLFNPGDDNPVAPDVRMPLHVAAAASLEMADVSGDVGLLKRIAEASGGRFLPIDRVNELPQLLLATSETRSHFFEIPLWNSPLLFFFVVACFGAEWAVRKRWGLA